MSNAFGTRRVSLWAVAAACAALFGCARTDTLQPYVDSAIESELAHIRAIDNHAHPVKVTAAGEEDHDYDALSMEGIPDLAMPAPFQDGDALFVRAWRALFGYDFSDATPAHLEALQAAKRAMGKRKGDLYPAWVLDETNTDMMLANRVSMGRGLTSDRFKWVPFADMFLFPLNNDAMKAQDVDHRVFITREEQLLSSYLSAAQLTALPSSLDEYTSFVSHMLERWKASGAVAVKFELAYLRDLNISDPPREVAEAAYAAHARGAEPSAADYRALQDYVFRGIARDAGRLGMPIHFHMALGAGSYFRVANANPLQLEGVFNDPALRKTKFVMLHGGWPFTREAAAEIVKPNVYVDFSAAMYLTYPAEEARAIRLYLESAPRKVLYGSDASPFSESVGWEETAWIGSNVAREAVGIALTAMMRDGEIDRDRAKQLAHMVMRDNARQLYGF